MLLYATAKLLLRALDEADVKLPEDVRRAMKGVGVALDMTDAQLAVTPEGAEISPLGPGTLAAAREFVAHHITEGSGIDCPCCGQSCKLYPRKLYAEMGAWLINLVHCWNQTRDWVDVRDFPLRGGDYGKLMHWGLAERMPNDNPAKRSSGMWRPTLDGIHFVMGRTRVPSHVHLYNNEVKGFSKEQVDIRQVLGEQFSYIELMHGGVE